LRAPAVSHLTGRRLQDDTLGSLVRLGALDVLEAYLSYLRNIIDHSEGVAIQPLYSVSGEGELTETFADGLAGYRGLGPVRVGNAAYSQIQHDAFGQIVLSSAQAFFDKRLLRPATAEDFAALEQVGERALATFDQPDAGLWEFRTKASIHTYSSVMCWAACDRLAKIATALGLGDRAGYWRKGAERIRRGARGGRARAEPRGTCPRPLQGSAARAHRE
jgi:GH15 family glucan-1,4-alpha-glucosidase